MVIAPAGSFSMGSPPNEQQRTSGEVEVQVSIPASFAVGRFAVSFDEWDTCVVNGDCNGYKPPDEGLGRGKKPVINISWEDSKTYTAWLSRKTGKSYRLLSEAEREYVTRADTTTPFWWGSSITPQQANYGNPNANLDHPARILPVDSVEPNPWGLYHVHGNVWEWTEDCWNATNLGNPSDGQARVVGGCNRRVVRGGSWRSPSGDLRAAYRTGNQTGVRNINSSGFRVARAMSPQTSGDDLKPWASQGDTLPVKYAPSQKLPISLVDSVTKSLVPAARAISSGEYRARAIGAIAAARSRAGLSDDVNALLEEAARATRSVKTKQDQALSFLARYQAEVGAFSQALQIAGSIKDRNWRGNAFKEVSEQYAKHRRFDEARRLAQSIGNDYSRSSALEEIPIEEANAGLIEDSLRDARAITGHNRERALSFVAIAMAKRGQIAQALELARTISDPFYRGFPLSNIIGPNVDLHPRILNKEQLEDSLRLAISVEQDRYGADRLASVAIGQAVAGLTAEAEDTLRQALRRAELTKDEDPKLTGLGTIASAQALLGRLEQAAQTVNAQKVSGFAVSWVLAWAGKLSEAQQFVQLVNREQRRGSEFVSLANAQLGAGMIAEAISGLGQALQSAQAVADPRERANLLAVIGVAQARASSVEEAILCFKRAEQAIALISDERDRAYAISYIVRLVTWVPQ
jgi:tetratricopeptide (TPR) repeat protein